MQDKLCFFSASADKAPGQGAQEHVVDQSCYKALTGIGNWRRVLSNFYPSQAPIPWQNHTFRSVEHAFHFTKISLAGPEAARLFALESGSDLSRSVGSVVKKAGRATKLSAEQLCSWDQNSQGTMQQLVATKAKVCWVFRTTLLSTQTAQLWHLRPRQSAQRWTWMEDLRQAKQRENESRPCQSEEARGLPESCQNTTT